MAPKEIRYRPYGLTNPAKRRIENPGINDYAIFTKYGIETDYKYFQVTTVVKPKGGVPTHLHHGYAESMKPISGRLAVEKGWGATAVSEIYNPGKKAEVKPGEWHRFFNPSDNEDCVFEASVAPAHQGFEIMLCVMYGLAEDGLATKEGLPKNPLDFLLAITIADMEYPQLGMKLLVLFAGIVTAVLTWTGRKEALIRRYYGVPIEEGEESKKEL